MKFSIKDFFSKRNQIRSLQWKWVKAENEMAMKTWNKRFI